MSHRVNMSNIHNDNGNFWNRLIPSRWKETLWGQQFIWFWRGNAYGLDDDDDDDDDDWPISLGVNLLAFDEEKSVFHFVFW